jgi:hypothetical protein
MSAFSDAIAYRWAINNSDEPIARIFLRDRKEPSKKMQRLACQWWRARNRIKQELLRGKKFHPALLSSYELRHIAIAQEQHEYKY